MKIIRKANIQTGLYTRGGTYQVSRIEDKMQKVNTYVGPYYIKNGAAYAGDIPRAGDKRLQRIIRNQNIFTYNKLNSKFAKKFTGVVSSPPIITEADEETGFFMRYFTKQLSSGEIQEVDIETYKEVDKQKTPHHTLYSAIEIEWKISGPIFNRLYKGAVVEPGIIPTNNKTLKLAEDSMPGLGAYIGDALEYGNPTEQSALYTPGDQFIREKSGDEYIGFYHIHINRPMVGKYHVSTPHENLIPLSETIFDPEQKTEEEKILQTSTAVYNSLQ